MNAMQKALALLMADISEESYCAGWLIGLEFDLWGMVNDGDSRAYGILDVTEKQVELMRGLSKYSGGWVFWNESTGEAEWIDLDEWLVMVAEKKDGE